MARAGAFKGIDAAMIHPAGVNLATMPSICIAEMEVIYHGKASHASAMPHKGVNALDGLLLAYQTISIAPTFALPSVFTALSKRAARRPMSYGPYRGPVLRSRGQ